MIFVKIPIVFTIETDPKNLEIFRILKKVNTEYLEESGWKNGIWGIWLIKSYTEARLSGPIAS